VSTSSTKQGAKKAPPKNRGGKGKYSRFETETAVAAEPDIPEKAWRIGMIAIFLVAAVLRLYDLNLVPLHHRRGSERQLPRAARLAKELTRTIRRTIMAQRSTTLRRSSLRVTKDYSATPRATNTVLTTFTIRTDPSSHSVLRRLSHFLLRRRLGSVTTLAGRIACWAVSPRCGLSLALFHSRDDVRGSLYVSESCVPRAVL
jgi:hypothetical protein